MTNRDELLIGYVHKALSKAERGQVEEWLKTSADTRAHLADLRQLQRGIEQGIRNELSHKQPPPSMTFSAIAEDIKIKRPRLSATHAMPRWLANMTAMAAMTVLIGALLFSLDNTSNMLQPGSGKVITTTPVNSVGIDQADEQLEMPSETAFPLTPTPTLSTLPSHSTVPRRENSPTIPTRTPVPDDASQLNRNRQP